jgi:peptide/nickel transport system permease protein
VAAAIPLLAAVVTVNFVLVHLAPGDPVSYLVGDPSLISAEQLQQMRANLGLDRPLPVQYVAYLGSLMRGDLGLSAVNQRPVLDVILERVPATLLLMGASLVVALVLGVAMGFVAALKARTPVDYLVGALSLVTYSMPPFWLALVLITVFSLRLEWFPTMGMATLGASHEGWAHVRDTAHHLALPTVALGTSYAAVYSKVFRASLLGVLGQPFIVTAKAKGLSWLGVYGKHAARNAALPVITFLGLQAGLVFTGAVVTEIVFAWPGVGMLTMNAILQRDYPLILGIFVMISLCVIAANAAADLMYSVVDPRITLH